MTASTTIQKIYHSATQMLNTLYESSEAKSISRILLTYVLEKSWFELSANKYDFLSVEDVEKLNQALNRLREGTPIQHITGISEFYGRQFVVNPHVLIPRQETEELTIWIRDSHSSFSSAQALQVIDIGTGSGCIPITLALEWDILGVPYHITGIDISTEALTIAKQNAKNLQAHVHWLIQDIFTAHNDQFNDLDIVVSNPPYIPEREKDTLHPNVKNYEPDMALYVPDANPLIYYETISRRSLHWLKAGGKLFFEIHADMGHAVCQLLLNQNWINIELKKDLSGRDRIVSAENPKTSYSK